MNWHLFNYFFFYLKPYWKKEILLLILMVLSAAGTLVAPYSLKIIIDTVLPSGNYYYLIAILSVLFIINILRILINSLSTYLFEFISNQITRDIRLDLFKHLIELPISFFNSYKIGDLVHRINNEVNNIQNILTGTVVRLINSICMIVGLSIMLIVLNYKLFFISMAITPLIFINTKWFQPKIQEMIRRGREKDADIMGFLMERFSNIKLIKSYVSYEYEQNSLSFRIKELISFNLKMVKLTTITQGFTLLLTTAVPLIILCFGGKQVIEGTMTVGALVAFIQYMNRIFDPFRNLMGLYFDSIKAVISMQRIIELFESRTEDKVGKIRNTYKEDIHFKNVSFSYEMTPVLTQIDISFSYGKKYALVGKSGCGKSTLISLICRFYDVDSGEIRLGEDNIRTLNIDALRKRIAYITQENQLYNETIYQNIKYGNLKSSDEEISMATDSVDILTHIESLELGFNTRIGDNGSGLSGGQKQRIAIARAILRDADIIILDEITSSLDAESEKKILDQLCSLYENKTMIVVSHRLNTVKDMDEIIFLENGRIKEFGTHTELMNKGAIYADLFREQMR